MRALPGRADATSPGAVRLLAVLTLLAASVAAGQSAPASDWAEPSVVVGDNLESEWLARVGDVDNLGFGWPPGFDPFCGRASETHGWPWDPPKDDRSGLDRILLSSRFNPDKPAGCGADGYSQSFSPAANKLLIVRFNVSTLKNSDVRTGHLQLFVDDFQAPSMCSRFQVTLNGRRFAEAEKLLNALDQTGPVGKLITLPLPEEFLQELTRKSELVLTIDEATGAADGFAVDFARLLVNRKREGTCRGTLAGQVVEKDSEAPLPGARVTLADGRSAVAGPQGEFSFADVPAGLELVTAQARGFADGQAPADVGQGTDNPPVVVRLVRGKALQFDNRTLDVGEALELKSLLFDQGRDVLKPASFKELDRVVALLKENPGAEIELAGHTSSEGDAAANRSLSYRRVNACKRYITGKGLDPGRIIAVGFGPDRPVAPNDTEKNRKLNRRVELRVVKN